MVQSALVADVTYALTFETGVDAALKASALRDIARSSTSRSPTKGREP